MWLPFIFSDTRAGRHSGILAPQFGFGDIVRNSPTYRRNVDHVGYYWALNDYMDFGDVARLAELRRRDRTAIQAGFATTPTGTTSGSIAFSAAESASATPNSGYGSPTNLAISWAHNQDFSHDAHLNTSLNYVTSTALQRQNTFNPYHGARDDRVGGELSEQVWPGVGLDRRNAQTVSGAHAGRPDAADAFSITTTPITLGDVAELDADAEL